MGDLIKFPTEERRVSVAKERAKKVAQDNIKKKKKGAGKLEQSLGRRKAAMRTEVLSNQMTDHMRRIGAIDYATRLEVLDVEVLGDISEVSVSVFEEIPN